jgi:hypothetical protein
MPEILQATNYFRFANLLQGRQQCYLILKPQLKTATQLKNRAPKFCGSIMSLRRLKPPPTLLHYQLLTSVNYYQYPC